MKNNISEKTYEKYAWIIFLVIGIMILIGGIPHMFGINTDPNLVETISGQSINEIKLSNPMLFNLYSFYFSGGGLSDIGVAFFLIIISIFAYRTGQKWSWYAMLFVPLFFISWIFIISSIPNWTQSSMFTTLIIFIILSTLGLILPFRKFFPKNSINK